MPAIRVNRDNVQITIEIEPSVDPPEASFYDAETNSWQEPHPGFAKQVHELEKVSDGDWGTTPTSLPPLGSPTSRHSLSGAVLVQDEADFKADGYYSQMVTKPSTNSSSTSRSCTRHPPTLTQRNTPWSPRNR
jgi:hypothetical protein